VARRKLRTIAEVVRNSLAAADPFYDGPHASEPVREAEDVRPLDPAKTAQDLGRLDMNWARDTLPEFPLRKDQPGPVGGQGPVPSSDASRKPQRL
jgi:hypothetical protein